ncbi:MAG: acyl-CoA dehydrogenase family protein, partial [Polyangiaceae bacterium]|nr:acyl-CoA dehydrogenase family protein [Polyangiaceae bacterium]
MATPEELEDFRREMRVFLEEKAPHALRGTSLCGPFDGYWGGQKHPGVAPEVLAWRDACFERGLTAPTWPKKYGGAGLSASHAKVLYEEM